MNSGEPSAPGRLQLPPLILGTMDRRGQSDDQRQSLFVSAFERGFTAFDTAPLYDFGRAEEQLGRAIRSLPRGGIQLLTKVGLNWSGESHGDVLFEYTDPEGHRRQVRKDSRPEQVSMEVHASLERLGVDCLDLVQIHHPDEYVPLAETLGALMELQREGRLRHIGVSNFSPQQILDAQAALGDIPLATVQQDYSLVRRKVEADLLPLCRDNGIDLIAYSPLGEGVLAGRPMAHPTPAHQNIAATVAEDLMPLAAQHGVSAAAIALAWVVAQPGVRSVITGASSLQQLEDQAQARNLVLSEDELARLGDGFSRVPLPYDWEIETGTLRQLARRGKRFLGRIARRIS